LTIILTLVIIRPEGCQGIKNKKNKENINEKEGFRNFRSITMKKLFYSVPEQEEIPPKKVTMIS